MPLNTGFDPKPVTTTPAAAEGTKPSPEGDKGHRTGAIIGMALAGVVLVNLGIQGITG